jgi:hypothetical protein
MSGHFLFKINVDGKQQDDGKDLFFMFEMMPNPQNTQ